MTYPLSRYVRDEVTLPMFVEGFQEYLLFAIKDPQNNVAELDKSIEPLLQNKIFSVNRPLHGLMYLNSNIAAGLLKNMWLINLLFYSRVFQQKHDWPTWYLSPISKQLLKDNALNKLPSIYSKYVREIDFTRNVIGLSTCDFFFVSFICYPIIIGPQIPRILNQIYSYHKFKKKNTTQTKTNTYFANILSQIIPSLQLKHDDTFNLEIPSNPFHQINFFYEDVFQFYLNLFLPPNSILIQRDQQAFYGDYNIKFIEIVGEMWFGQTFKDRPIGDRHQTLGLMQDLLFRIMEKQIDYQYQNSSSNPSQSHRYRHGQRQRGSSSMTFDSKSDVTSMILSTSSYNERLFGLGKIPKTSCICPELRCLLRYLYLFFRESFEHFPLDFIANLQKVIEMLLYVLAPWAIQYKLHNPDKSISRKKKAEYMEYQTKLQQMSQSKRGIFGKFVEKVIGNLNKGRMADNMNMNNDLFNYGYLQFNDDRERNETFNNTQFLKAEDLITYELEGIDSFDMKIWRQYIIEMLPFYSTLINYLIDTLLKYDFSHPLKQICVLKVLHLYQNEEIVGLIKQTENCLFSPYNNNDNQNINVFHQGFSMDNFANSEPIYVMNIITDITTKRLNEYRCSPFPVMTDSNIDLYHGQPQLINLQQLNHSRKLTNDKAQQLYIKCRKALVRLSPIIQQTETKEPEPNQTENNQQQQPQTQTQTEQPSTTPDSIKTWIIYLLSLVVCIFQWLSSVIGKININQTATQQRQQRQQRQPQQTQKRMIPGHGQKIDYFTDPADKVLIIRYIIGELEQLFNIGTEQQQLLMNMSIMYEPSTSVTPQTQRTRSVCNERVSSQQRRYREMYNVWRIPKGEWEWSFILGIHKWIYQNLIFGSKMNDFYCQHLAKYHRLYLCDMRVLSWFTVLVLSWFFLYRFIFTLLLMIFIAMFIMSLKANMNIV